MATSDAQFFSARACGPCEAWRFGWMVSELWWTSAFGMLSRNPLLSVVPGLDARDRSARREWQCLWSEKALSGMEAGLAMQRAGYDLLLGRCDPLQASQRMLSSIGVSGSRVRNRGERRPPGSLLDLD